MSTSSHSHLLVKTVETAEATVEATVEATAEATVEVTVEATAAETPRVRRSSTVLAAVSLDANGVGTLPIDVPAEPALSGTVGWFQSLQTGLGGGARVSLPAALVVGQ